MGTMVNLVLILALGIWIGSIVFFSFGVAPVLFRVLSPTDAGKVVRAVFPVYYLIGIVCGVVAVITLLVLSRQAGWSPAVLLPVGLLLVMVVINLYARQSLMPRINAARDAGEAQQERFDRLHRQSVILNGIVLVLGLIVMALIARAATLIG